MLPGCPPGPVHALPQIALDSALRVTYARRAHHYGASPCHELLARCSAGLSGDAPAFGWPHASVALDNRGGKMAFKLNHLHIKTKDPQQTAKFYVDNMGAKIVAEIGTRGYRLDLHGLTINLTTHVEDQTRQQLYGMEHFALNTDDLDGTVAKLKANGAQVLEQMTSGNGRRICFLEGPDGVQLEIIEAQV
jgi:catechol 2,3-dioxygenase-like lactoylglutathione lyase family enzyme